MLGRASGGKNSAKTLTEVCCRLRSGWLLLYCPIHASILNAADDDDVDHHHDDPKFENL